MDEISAPRPSDPAVETPAQSSLPTRRRVLAIVAVTGAGGAVLAACGGGSTASTGSGSSASTPAAGGGSSSAAGGGGGGKELVATSKVPVGGGVILDGPKVVVTQPTAGTFKAFSAVCTHMGCTVGSVRNGVISCPCHGSAYSATDGSVKNGPSTTPLPPVSVTVQGNKVVQA